MYNIIKYNKIGGKNMRNPDRLDSFYEEMCKIHKERFPDWRFGQLMVNFFSWLLSEGKTNDIFFPEEEKMIEWFNEYAKQI